MRIELAQLNAIMPYAAKAGRTDAYLEPLNVAMAEGQINTPQRAAAFLAQIAHESGELHYTSELASGAAYDTGALAKQLGNTPEADGDGQRWKGHGLIQITGRANHQACADFFGIALDDIAHWLTQPEGACRSAAWFWRMHKLNEMADYGLFDRITRRINGGVNGINDRLMYWGKAKKALGVIE